jgi:hypothetical protein
MKVSDFETFAKAELAEHIGPMAEIIVQDSLAGAKVVGKTDLTPLELRMLMLHFKMNIPGFLDASTLARKVEQRMLLKR